MVFVDEGERLELGGKVFIVHRAPATVAYDVAIRQQLAQEKQDADEMVKCLYPLLKYVEVDLGDNRCITLDNMEIINQHIKSPTDLLKLQTKAVAVNFPSSTSESH